MNVGARVVKVKDGRAVPIGTRGTVEFIAGSWVFVAWDAGDKCVVRKESVEEVLDETRAAAQKVGGSVR